MFSENIMFVWESHCAIYTSIELVFVWTWSALYVIFLFFLIFFSNFFWTCFLFSVIFIFHLCCQIFYFLFYFNIFLIYTVKCYFIFLCNHYFIFIFIYTIPKYFILFYFNTIFLNTILLYFWIIFFIITYKHPLLTQFEKCCFSRLAEETSWNPLMFSVTFGCAITQACQVELACVWKRSALYVILQSSFVSRVQPTKCLSSDELGYFSLKASVSMYTYLRLIKRLPFRTHFLL